VIEKNNCLGIPIRYDPDAAAIVDSTGLLKKEIVVSRAFFALAPREQGAFLLHEAGHCKCNHARKLAWFILRSPRRVWRFLRCAKECSKMSEAEFFKEVAARIPELAAYRIAQEFEADRFAAGCGYGGDLARAFGRLKSGEGPFHPPLSLRIARLVGG